MLQIRPVCENCNKALPPDSVDARICSFECTFCSDCVENILENVCPNCGGGFERRPVRPAHNWKGGNSLGEKPAATEIRYRPVDLRSHAAFSATIKGIPPEQR